jgi:hypothetical protein
MVPRGWPIRNVVERPIFRLISWLTRQLQAHCIIIILITGLHIYHHCLHLDLENIVGHFLLPTRYWSTDSFSVVPLILNLLEFEV